MNFPARRYSTEFILKVHLMLCVVCVCVCVHPAVGPSLVHAVEDRPCPSRVPAASVSESSPMNSCMPWALCTSNRASTGTTMSPSSGQIFGGVISMGQDERRGGGAVWGIYK